MKILVTGASGQVGRCIVGRALSDGQKVVATYCSKSAEFPGATVARLDKTDIANVRSIMVGERPDVVIDTGALHNVDFCQDNPASAYAVNRDGTRNLAETAMSINATFVYISTDFVFDGEKGQPYIETDPTHPLSHYAESKLAGERAATSASEKCIIVRPSVIYSWLGSRSRGPSSSGKSLNFGTWLVEELTHRRPVRIIHDQIASPTLAEDLAAAILALASGEHAGTFHTAGSTATSRYDFSVALASRLGLDSALISPVSTSDLQQKARRPPNSSLDSHQLQRVTGHQMLELSRALDRFAHDYYESR